MAKLIISTLLAALCFQYIAAQTQYFSIGGGGGRGDYSAERVSYRPQARRVYVQQPSYDTQVSSYTPQRAVYRQRDSGYGDDYSKGANYDFAYKVRASGKGYGGGYGKDDGGYGGGAYGGSSAEFGHSESRKGDKTTGRYFVELPDGRLQTVDYYVDGYSGYVAKVSYSGGGYDNDRRQAYDN